MSTQRADFYEILKTFNNAMFVSQSDKGLHARPMAVAAIEPARDTIWFATSVTSDKVDEVLSHPEVSVAFQGNQKYASVKGTARVNQDRAKINQLWEESWEVWFPEGKEDPRIALIEVTAEHGEYWDQSGTEGLKFLYETAKAYISGGTPDMNREQHDTVPLHDAKGSAKKKR